MLTGVGVAFMKTEQVFREFIPGSYSLIQIEPELMAFSGFSFRRNGCHHFRRKLFFHDASRGPHARNFLHRQHFQRCRAFVFGYNLVPLFFIIFQPAFGPLIPRLHDDRSRKIILIVATEFCPCNEAAVFVIYPDSLRVMDVIADLHFLVVVIGQGVREIPVAK